jgi:hypothetical protein
MERLDVGQVYHGAADGEDRVFEYSVHFWDLSSRIQIRLWDWSEEAAAELMDLDCQPGLYHTAWNKLLTRPNRDPLTVDPEGVDTHGTAVFREIRATLADRADAPNTMTLDLEPGQGHRIVALTVEFRLRSDGHKIMIETCSMRDEQGKRFEDKAAMHALDEKTREVEAKTREVEAKTREVEAKTREVEEREERVRAREAGMRLGYMKLLEMANGMEHILESFND